MSERRPSNEAEFQEQADGALTQQLGEARGVMDGEEVELAIRVESAFQDQGRAFRHPKGGRRACAPGAHASARFCHPWHDVEVRINTERISKGLMREDCSAGDGLAGSGGGELGDQLEDEAGDEAEDALVVAKEDAKGFGQREDKP